jgi:hypothetical protein
MMRMSVFVVAAGICGMFVPCAAAQGVNSVLIGGVGVGTGTISTGGGYTLAPGYTLVGISVNAAPTGGASGEGGQAAAKTTGPAFNTTVSAPSGGSYDVQAVMTVSDGSGNLYYYFSRVIQGVGVP